MPQEGIKTLLREAGLPVDIHEIPLAWLIEFQKHNPLWNIFGVTGEQLYNWGLLNSSIVAWMMTNFTSWAQFFALNLGISSLPACLAPLAALRGKPLENQPT